MFKFTSSKSFLIGELTRSSTKITLSWLTTPPLTTTRIFTRYKSSSSSDPNASPNSSTQRSTKKSTSSSSSGSSVTRRRARKPRNSTPTFSKLTQLAATTPPPPYLDTDIGELALDMFFSGYRPLFIMEYSVPDEFATQQPQQQQHKNDKKAAA